MALRVPNCCFCFDLKYGFLTFGVISLICRVIILTMSWGSAVLAADVIANLAMVDDAGVFYKVASSYNFNITAMLGYATATTIALFFALRGIMMEKSILIFPYIVVLVIEIIADILLHIYLIAVVTNMFLISLLISVGK
ncbi:hypothetical protein ILUMI_00002 [Ignelater luminosus]|uniref:Uncharacterized protein n=1 Tax=Ignelater luminosus TaxID=2038154 RepID=A0A8K0GN15_IGNLU|nr:hypothetical protein ILUMI_00002 [Ignelater luminosus]